MSKKQFVNVDFKNADAKVKADILLISFIEEDNFIIYSPHLEVTGYGKSETAAMDSFNYSLGVFLDYTVNKKTLHDELISLGWKLKKGTVKHPKKIDAPSIADLMKKNNTLENLFNTKNISTSHKQVAIPV